MQRNSRKVVDYLQARHFSAVSEIMNGRILLKVVEDYSKETRRGLFAEAMPSVVKPDPRTIGLVRHARWPEPA